MRAIVLVLQAGFAGAIRFAKATWFEAWGARVCTGSSYTDLTPGLTPVMAMTVVECNVCGKRCTRTE